MPWKHLLVFPPRIAILMLLWVICILLQAPMHGLSRDDMAAGLLFAVLLEWPLNRARRLLPQVSTMT